MEFSSLFTQDETIAFLNAGTLSRTPLDVLEAMARMRREEERNPTVGVFLAPKLAWEAQVELAPFLGARPDELFFRANITAALNDFVFGLEIPPGGEFLATGLEYGATANLVQVRAKQLGCTFRSFDLPLSAEVSEAGLYEAVVGAFRNETKLLVVSHVATATGTVLPVARIAKAAKERGIVVIVDGAHAVGALPLNLRDLDVDFYGGNFHKWFMGPKGTAFGWVHPRWESKIQWKFGGWASFEKPAHYLGFQGGTEAAARFFAGTVDVTPFRALPKVLEVWQKFGPEWVRGRQRALRDLAAREAEDFGWQRVSPRDPGLLGPLVSFDLPSHWPSLPPGELAGRILAECRVQLSIPVVQGRHVVRLSPGAYGSEDEVRRGMERLRAFKA